VPLAVRFNEYGDIDVLEVVDVPRPVAGPGQVLVKVVAAGINPGEAAIRKGLVHGRWPATFPSGEGSDLAGVVAEVGAGVTRFAAGDEVVGFVDTRGSHAELVVAEAAAGTSEVLGELVGLIADGRLEIPIAKTYPLAEVREAFRDLEQRHTLGKIVLEP